MQQYAQPAIIHALWLLSLGIVCLRRKQTSPECLRAAVYILMFTTTAMCLNIVVSLVELPLSRYALAAELPMNAAMAIAIAGIALSFVRWLRRPLPVVVLE